MTKYNFPWYLFIYEIFKKNKNIKWTGISGSWRYRDKEIENDVRQVVAKIMKRGDGIISGGALNVDSIALDEAMKYDFYCQRIKIFIPTTLDKFIKHHRQHAKLGNISTEQAEALINQLLKLKTINSAALIEDPDSNFTEENKLKCYYDRNSDIIEASDHLVAFRVKTKYSEGLGTADAISKAKAKGIPVDLHFYDKS